MREGEGGGGLNRGLTVSHHHVSAGYLKLYQLSRPVLSGFDCLLIDEAQDCTPGMNIIYIICQQILIESFRF